MRAVHDSIVKIYANGVNAPLFVSARVSFACALRIADNWRYTYTNLKKIVISRDDGKVFIYPQKEGV